VCGDQKRRRAASHRAGAPAAAQKTDSGLGPNASWGHPPAGLPITFPGESRSSERPVTAGIEDAMMPVFSPENREPAGKRVETRGALQSATRSPRAGSRSGKIIEAMAYSEDGNLLATAVMSVSIRQLTNGQRARGR